MAFSRKHILQKKRICGCGLYHDGHLWYNQYKTVIMRFLVNLAQLRVTGEREGTANENLVSLSFVFSRGI